MGKGFRYQIIQHLENKKFYVTSLSKPPGYANITLDKLKVSNIFFENNLLFIELFSKNFKKYFSGWTLIEIYPLDPKITDKVFMRAYYNERERLTNAKKIYTGNYNKDTIKPYHMVKPIITRTTEKTQIKTRTRTQPITASNLFNYHIT